MYPVNFPNKNGESEKIGGLMKIEMGESLMRSWLRHVQGCQLAELNWKPSSTWVIRDQQKLMDKANAHFSSKLGYEIFGGTKLASQLLCQAEIDVLGIKSDSLGKIEKVFAVDVAFHEAGLNYRGNSNSLAKVLKKMVRSAMVAVILPENTSSFGICVPNCWTIDIRSSERRVGASFQVFQFELGSI
ncbi:MAG: hypothetical protein IPK04_15370 [Bdellovibrionales bacterium]|nr:hypothetical protein [Bdellovibrionales bacterium]